MNYSHIHRLPKDYQTYYDLAAGQGQEQEDRGEEVDIAAELQRVAFEGLAFVGHAIRLAECLRGQLAHITLSLETVLANQHHAPGDDVELCAATSLLQVDELLRQQSAKEVLPLPLMAKTQLTLLQRHLQDMAVLASSRFIDQTILQDKKIPKELLWRLEASFGTQALANDDLWSRLGNCKYNVFTKGTERQSAH